MKAGRAEWSFSQKQTGLKMNELRDFLQLIAKNFLVVLITGVSFGSAALFLSLRLPVQYRASLILYIERVPERPGNFYAYDGYYATQAAEAYTDTVLGLLRSLDLVKEAAENVKLAGSEATLKKLNRKIRIAKTAPQLIEIATTLTDAQSASVLTQSLAQTVINRVKLLNQSGNQNFSINPASPQPLLETVTPYTLLNTLVAFWSGVLMAIAGISLKKYLTD